MSKDAKEQFIKATAGNQELTYLHTLILYASNGIPEQPFELPDTIRAVFVEPDN